MIRQPTDSDVKLLLNESGIQYKDKGDYFLLKCPFHDDSNPSAVIYKDKHLFKCFVCAENYSFSYFYYRLKGKPWNEHQDFYLRQIPVVRQTMTIKERQTFCISEGVVTSVYDNAKALSYCRNRGVSNEFMQQFRFQATDLCKLSVGNGRSSIWCNRLLIPIDFECVPYSLEGRDYTRRQLPKCLYPRGCKTDVCFNQDALDKSKTLIVCEGIMDIHKIWTGITRNVTCTFGVSLSQKQKDFLCDVKDLILFIDDDEAGYKSVSTFEKFMRYDFKVAVVRGHDPGDSPLAQLNDAIANAVLWIDFLIDNTQIINSTQSFSLNCR